MSPSPSPTSLGPASQIRLQTDGEVPGYREGPVCLVPQGSSEATVEEKAFLDKVAIISQPTATFLQRLQANNWLKGFSESQSAWLICNQVLQAKPSKEACLQAAQILKNKIMGSFHELSPEARPSLRDSLLQHIRSSDFWADRNISTQLAQAMADLCCHMAEWQNGPLDVIQALKDSSPGVLCTLLLFLKLAPEEIDNENLHLTSERKKKIEYELGLNSAPIYGFLWEKFQTCYAAGDIASISCILECLYNWLHFGGEGSRIFHTLPLFDVPFLALDNEELVDPACECIFAALGLAADKHHHEELRVKIFPKVMSLFDKLGGAIQAGNWELAKKLVQIFDYLGDVFAEQIVSQPSPENERLVKIMSMLCAVQSPDGTEGRDISRSVFNFWCRFAEEILKIDGQKARYGSRFQDLFKALTMHSKCKIDSHGILIAGDDEDLVEYRKEVTDLLEATRGIAGTVALVPQILQQLKGSSDWNDIESNLFILKNIARENKDLTEGHDTIIQVLAYITKLDVSCKIQLRHSAVELVGELASWIECHPDSLGPICQFLASTVGLVGERLKAAPMEEEKESLKILGRAATHAVQLICTECKTSMLPHYEALVGFAHAAPGLGLNQADVVELIEGASKVLARAPPQTCALAFETLVAPMVSSLEHMIESPGLLNLDSRKDMCLMLRRIAASFRHCNILERDIRQAIDDGLISHHPLLSVVEKLWPLFINCFKISKGDDTVVEATNQCMRFILTSMKKHAEPMLKAMAELQAGIFQEHGCSSCVYIGSKILDMFGSSRRGDLELAHQPWPQTEVKPILSGMLDVMVKKGLQLLGESPTSMRDNPDLTEDFFKLLQRVLEQCPLVFMELDSSLIFEAAISGVLLHHRHSNDCVLMFLQRYVACAKYLKASSEQIMTETPALVEVIQSHVHKTLEIHGEKLIHNCVLALTGGVPSNLTYDVIELLFEFTCQGKEMHETFMKWIESSPRLKEFPDTYVSSDHVEAFLRGMQRIVFKNYGLVVIAEESSKNDFRGACKAFSKLFTFEAGGPTSDYNGTLLK